jgi:hypothetical protein
MNASHESNIKTSWHPQRVTSEISWVLKPDGWLRACAPNKWGYVGIGARLVPNWLHAKIVSFVQPGSRKGTDIFPTRFRVNTPRATRRLFTSEGFDNRSFCFNAQSSNNFGAAFAAWLWNAYMAILPRALAQYLFVFVWKKAYP